MLRVFVGIAKIWWPCDTHMQHVAARIVTSVKFGLKSLVYTSFQTDGLLFFLGYISGQALNYNAVQDGCGLTPCGVVLDIPKS